MPIQLARTRTRYPGSIYQYKNLRPNDLPNLGQWLKADGILWSSGTTPCNDGDGVATWVDATAYRNDFGQGTSGNRPLYKTNIINGLPVVRFDGSNDYLQGDSASQFGNNFTLMTVITPSSTSPIGIFDTAPNTAQTLRQYNAGQVEIQSARPQFNLSLANTNTVLLEFVVEVYHGANVNQVTYYRNSALISTNTGSRSNVVWTSPVIGGINLTVAGAFTGDMGEFIVWSGLLDTPTRHAMEAYLMNKWGITG